MGVGDQRPDIDPSNHQDRIAFLDRPEGGELLDIDRIDGDLVDLRIYDVVTVQASIGKLLTDKLDKFTVVLREELVDLGRLHLEAKRGEQLRQRVH